ncbi:MAG: penicillin-binding transpeptidase domain-containing protein [Barnesiella sp.]
MEGKIDLTRMSYGYSTAIPPIYILALYNTIANNGKFVRPRLVKELIKEGNRFDIQYRIHTGTNV